MNAPIDSTNKAKNKARIYVVVCYFKFCDI